MPNATWYRHFFNQTVELGLGAIVEGPEGLVFFKLTGPAATVRSASAEFDAMLHSLK